MQRFADLHIHTYFSDGTDSPQEVVAQARVAGLSCIAITDHDVLDAVASAMEAGATCGLEVIAGVELSTQADAKDMHILGYFVNHTQGLLFNQCERFREKRQERMKEMIANLKSAGVDDITYEEVCALTKSRAVGRVHLALLLKQKGWVKSITGAFGKYLGDGCPGYAPKYRQTPFEAIDLIHSSGGLAVMAHPMLTQKDEWISRLANAGLDGLEVYYPNCSDVVTQFYARIARKYKLLMTGGSDAHGTVKAYTHIGKNRVSYETVEAMKDKVRARGIV